MTSVRIACAQIAPAVGDAEGNRRLTRKALSLEGVLVPASAEWNEGLLRQAGFAEVECLWRWLNFGAWLAVRSG